MSIKRPLLFTSAFLFFLAGVPTAHAVSTVNLTASKSSIFYGDSITLSWTSSNIAHCTGVGFSTGNLNPPNGSVTVTPSFTPSQTYSINCTGPGGATAYDSVTVQVYYPADLTSGAPSLKSFVSNLSSSNAVFSATISNIGQGDATTTFKVLWQRADTSAGYGAFDMAVSNSPALTAGSSTTLTLSKAFSPGTYFIRVCADKSSATDAKGTVNEEPNNSFTTQEDNNCTNWTQIALAAPAWNKPNVSFDTANMKACYSYGDIVGVRLIISGADSPYYYPVKYGVYWHGTPTYFQNNPPSTVSNSDIWYDAYTDHISSWFPSPKTSEQFTTGNSTTQQPYPFPYPTLTRPAWVMSGLSQGPGGEMSFTPFPYWGNNPPITSLDQWNSFHSILYPTLPDHTPGKAVMWNNYGSFSGATTTYYIGVFARGNYANAASGPANTGWVTLTYTAVPCNYTDTAHIEAGGFWPGDVPVPFPNSSFYRASVFALCTSTPARTDPLHARISYPGLGTYTYHASGYDCAANLNGSGGLGTWYNSCVSPITSYNYAGPSVSVTSAVSEGGWELYASHGNAKEYMGGASIQCILASKDTGSSGDPSVASQSISIPVAYVSCAPSATTVTVGQPVTWTATTNQTAAQKAYYNWDYKSGGGIFATSTKYTVTYTTTGTKTMSVVSYRNKDNSAGPGSGTSGRLATTEGVDCDSSVTVTTGSAPDLTAGVITPTFATTNVGVTLSSTISNLSTTTGTGNSFVDLFQKATTATGTNATDIGTFANTALSANGTKVATLSNYKFTTAGTWYVRACADKSSGTNTGTIPESNEGNNCGGWTEITVMNPNSLTAVPIPCQIGATQSTCQGTNRSLASGNFTGAAGVKVFVYDPYTDGFTSILFNSASTSAASFSNLPVDGIAVGSSTNPSLELRAFTYNWKHTGDGACVNGTSNWIYKCIRSDGTTVAAADCSLKTKPTNSSACTCTENWTCGSWSTCSGGTQTRTCTDSNSCGTTTNKPPTSQACGGSCVANQGQPCTSAPNSCGATNSGTIQCNGSCSATTPSDSICGTWTFLERGYDDVQCGTWVNMPNCPSGSCSPIGKSIDCKHNSPNYPYYCDTSTYGCQ